MAFRLGLFVAAALAAAPMVAPMAAQAQGLVGGAEQGAAAGNAAAGPVGAIVGGAVGAATGTVDGILGINDRPRFRTYVEQSNAPSYTYAQPLRPGVVLPETYTYYPVPAGYNLQPAYQYTVVNGHPVIVEPATRRIVQVVE